MILTENELKKPVYSAGSYIYSTCTYYEEYVMLK